MNTYIIKKFKFKLNQLINAPYATYLCIRFPFLYPRNRFTDKHYNNWTIQNKIKNIKKKYVVKHISDSIDYVNYNTKVKYSIKDTILLYSLESIHHILSILHSIPTYTELNALDKGWRKSFGLQLCKELKSALKKDNLLHKFRIMQLKEKWGQMELYCSYANQETYDIIQKYQFISYYTCCECGKPAHYLSNGWILPFCEDHAPIGTIEREKFYGYTKSIYKTAKDNKTYSYEELYANDEKEN